MSIPDRLPVMSRGTVPPLIALPGASLSQAHGP